MPVVSAQPRAAAMRLIWEAAECLSFVKCFTGLRRGMFLLHLVECILVATVYGPVVLAAGGFAGNYAQQCPARFALLP
eukprot:2871670-Amphidinium_carterae.3